MGRYAGFVGPTYTSQNTTAADDRVVNWYPAKIESGTGPAEWVFDPAPGYRFKVEALFDTGLGDDCRGLFTANNTCWVVFGTGLFQLSTPITGTVFFVFDISNLSNSLVSMATNGDAGNQLMAASDGVLYCHTILPIAQQVDIIGTVSGHFVAFMDGYFIALNTDTSSIFVSDFEDGTTWDPLSVLQRSDTPDKWISMITRPKEIWAFGQETTTVLYNDGQSDPPFVPNTNVAIPFGTAAARSVALLNGSPIWLANDLCVRYANGYTPQRVSTHAIEWQIRRFTTVSDAEAFSYTQDGHLFYELSFPTEQATFVYDLTSGQWHERGAWNGLTYDACHARCSTFVDGMTIVGLRAGATVSDRSVGSLYEYTPEVSLEPNTEVEPGADIYLRRLRRAPHLVSELKRMAFYNFQLHMEVGIATATGDGSDPQMYLRWSNDGGQSFGNVLASSIGQIGQYTYRVIWHGSQGQSRDRIFEVFAAEAIPLRLVDAYLDVRVGTS